MAKKNWNQEEEFDKEDIELYNNTENTFEEDDDEIDDIKEQKMLETLDSDLLKYFNEARITKKKQIGNKKTKKEKNIFSVGEKVKFNNIVGTILFGPYEKNDKLFYEIETEYGIVSIEDKGNNIQKM